MSDVLPVSTRESIKIASQVWNYNYTLLDTIEYAIHSFDQALKNYWNAGVEGLFQASSKIFMQNANLPKSA